ncbi:hypothetical protein KIN20_032863 [Parelaphostrongylus tenuis]|uniref:Uncharacterized protein n=1 Tax=Parelaphostrongylus tenuis TaxID=148309 RepID=A0AAD5WHZ1_PARTN|nr:hypothetical protein KIN20_032863 [Parelaphostrongylus tenuis]
MDGMSCEAAIICQVVSDSTAKALLEGDTDLKDINIGREATTLRVLPTKSHFPSIHLSEEKRLCLPTKNQATVT